MERPVASREAATVDEIKTAVLELEKAFADQDVEAIRRLASPDHISLAANYGKPVALEEQLATLAEFHHRPSDFSSLEVTLLGDGAALVNFENALAGTWQGEPLPPRVYVTEIWLKRDGKWRQRLYQETPVAPP